MTKKCSICEIEKPVTEFHKHKTNPTGYYASCKICRKQQTKNDYKKRTEDIKRSASLYYSKNKEIIKVKRRSYQKTRLKNDETFKIIRNLRNRLWYALNNKFWEKNTHFSEYIGLNNYEDLKIYIEQKFQEGMSWDNYGEWEIDHIIPLASAKTEEELYKLCHYSNLQPLWASENRKKRDKI